MSEEPLSVSIGEQLCSDYSVHELPEESTSLGSHLTLLARINALEAETRRLNATLAGQGAIPWRISCIANNDELIRIYTGFVSYEVLLAYYEFLGPPVHQLHYWGKNIPSGKHKRLKLDPLTGNQLFLTLVKLRLNLQEQDLACRFGISSSLVSRYFITWICFLYHHMKEIKWMSSPSQVASTLLPAFKEGYIHQHLQSWMLLRFFWRHLVIYFCNRQLGAVTKSQYRKGTGVLHSKWCSFICVSLVCWWYFRC